MNFLKKLATAAFALAGLALASTAIAAYTDSPPAPDVLFDSGTNPHNLNNLGLTIGNSEICLPCHVPHGGNKNASASLLWNHSMPTNPTYIMWGTTPASNLDSSSKLCLSCHDGTVAVDSYGAGPGAGAGTKTIDQIGDGAAKLGQDLSNSHPIGVKYPGTTLNATTGVVTWSATAGWNDPTAAAFKANGVGGKSAVRLVTLGNNTDAGVGCGTCHTPHNYAEKFLRHTNTGSQLCLKCHQK